MIHASHPDIIARLKRAHGHLASVIQMIEAERPCVDLAQQLHAVEKAIVNAKRELIQDHIDHCLEDAVGENGRAAKAALTEFKTLTKYL
jgi:DNA-binding FrmR family transcriptional regulator